MPLEPTLEEKLAREPEWMNRPAVSCALRNIPIIILLASLFLLYGYFLAHKIDLTTADLGRHIKNGEMLLSEAADVRGLEDAQMYADVPGKVLKSNYYSYTAPDFSVINHHWGSGLLFYLAWSIFGFTGLQLFFILLSLASLAVFLAAGRLYAPWGVVGLVALPAIFLLGERTEIRPEVFSYLLAGLFFLILSRYGPQAHSSFIANTYGRRYLLWSGKALWLLPFFEVLWVNTHIYFLLGPLLIGAFLLEALIARRETFAKLLAVFAATLAATLVNPFGYRALTGALSLFENFGYRLAENQSIFFLERLGMANPNFLIFKVLFGILALSFLITIYRKWRGIRLAHVFVAGGVAILAFLASRNLALFGFFSVPIIAAHIHTAFGSRLSGTALGRAAAALAAAGLLFSIVFTLPQYFPYWRSFGFGLEAGNDAAAEFIQSNDIAGPLFNNYDIGGYLIFHLFPKEKVFVDNRPEAYPKEFFEKTYIPMQEDEAVWRGMLAKYSFNAIIFAYRDATPWGQRFLRERISDPEWAPVFADDKVLVLVRRTGENEAIIGKFELPREMFVPH